MAARIFIDLCDDDEQDEAAAKPVSTGTSVGGQKDSEPPTNELSTDSDGAEDGEIEAAFSEGEEDEEDTGQTADTPDADGYDFSGTCVADATHNECPLCDVPFQVSWDADCQSLVYPGTVMLRHQIFHADCFARRRGAPEENSVASRKPTPPPALYTSAR